MYHGIRSPPGGGNSSLSTAKTTTSANHDTLFKTLTRRGVKRRPPQENAKPQTTPTGTPTEQQITTHTNNPGTTKPKEKHRTSPPENEADENYSNNKHNKEKHTTNHPQKRWDRKQHYRKYLRKRLFQEGKNRPTVLSAKYGLNTLAIVSMNPDHLTTNEVQQDITQQLLKNKLHIEIIQETHIPKDQSFSRNEYRVITSAATPNPKVTPEKHIPGRYIAGVAIAIQQELEPHISTIERIDHRILKITLDREDAKTPVTILATYAPHQGYNNHEKSNHWEKVYASLETIPKHHLTIWGADANGQLGREIAHPEKYNKIIGPYTLQNKP